MELACAGPSARPRRARPHLKPEKHVATESASARNYVPDSGGDGLPAHPPEATGPARSRGVPRFSEAFALGHARENLPVAVRNEAWATSPSTKHAALDVEVRSWNAMNGGLRGAAVGRMPLQTPTVGS